MKVVIPWIGPDSTELRYTLRSIDRYMTSVTEICIISKQLPPWAKGVNHISFTDHPSPKYNHRNVWNKVNAAPYRRFLYWPDDCYLLQAVDNIPRYYTGTLRQALDKINPGNAYWHTINNTIGVLSDSHMAYNTHIPFYIDKATLEPLAELDWSIPHGYCLKTLYCKGGTYTDDLKLKTERNPDLTGRVWFSTSPTFMSRGGERFLNKMYPNKSRWER